MKRLIFIIFLGLALMGCTTNTNPLTVRGSNGIEIDCSGLGSGWERCHRRAAKECKGAYKILARSDDVKEEDFSPFGFNPAGYFTRTMLVICR